jgi:lipoprotein-anchoring transpeptidase ErfK/SrfK
MYYGTVFRVIDLVTGRDGKSWYHVEEMYQKYYIRATHMRLIPDVELAPLSPEVRAEDKWVDVDLRAQILVAYEQDKPVFAHRVATGLKDHGTPDGRHYVFDKRISERMVGGSAASEEDSDHYNLAGVPFVCYFTPDWVALHGTFWHNDYGQPHSHGCVNLPSEASRWLWRWTSPVVLEGLLDRFFVRPETYQGGTRIEVHW